MEEEDAAGSVDDATATSNESEPTVVRAVARAVDVMMALSGGPMRLGDISALVNLSKPTTHRLLFSLKSVGIVTQDSLSGEYGLGPACYRLMSAMSSGGVGFSAPILESLRDATGETITIHVRAGLSRICIQEFPSPHPIRYIAGLGATAGIYVGSAGKVLLAFMAPADRERILSEIRPTALTDTTITDPGALKAELQTVQEQRFALSYGERVEGAMGVSAPIFDPIDGTALAALSVLGPTERITRNLDVLIKRAQEAGVALSESVA